MWPDAPELARVAHDSNNLADPPQRRFNMAMVDSGFRIRLNEKAGTAPLAANPPSPADGAASEYRGGWSRRGRHAQLVGRPQIEAVRRRRWCPETQTWQDSTEGRWIPSQRWPFDAGRRGRSSTCTSCSCSISLPPSRAHPEEPSLGGGPTPVAVVCVTLSWEVAKLDEAI